MKKSVLLLVLSILSINLSYSQNIDYVSMDKYGKYNQSSLCVIMLTHEGKEYAEEMEAQFDKIKLPPFYHEHNSHIKVISVSKKAKKKYVEYLMKDTEVAKEMVAKWFNRNVNTGFMDMNLVRTRSDYNADYVDNVSAEDEISSLLFKSTGLIKNTFVVVCDMDYFDKEKAGMTSTAVLAVLAASFDAYAHARLRNHDLKAANNASIGTFAATMGALATSNIEGYRMKMKTFLFRLDWSDECRNEFYQEYWVDANTPKKEANSRKAKFVSDNKLFNLEYLGSYSSKSSKTTFKNVDELGEVLNEVTANTINKTMASLETMSLE
ncbi:MAG: hypothetical protein R3Y26_02505 [Rikenellaceae bacterium]